MATDNAQDRTPPISYEAIRSGLVVDSLRFSKIKLTFMFGSKS